MLQQGTESARSHSYVAIETIVGYRTVSSHLKCVICFVSEIAVGRDETETEPRSRHKCNMLIAHA